VSWRCRIGVEVPRLSRGVLDCGGLSQTVLGRKLPGISTVQKIEAAIPQRSRAGLEQLDAWFEDYLEDRFELTDEVKAEGGEGGRKNAECRMQRLRSAGAVRWVPLVLTALDAGRRLCYTQGMSDTLTVRIPGREKDAWQKVAKTVGEELSEFARKAVRQRVQAVQARHGSPWDDLLGSVSANAPPATNANVRKAMRSGRP
jgi:hypothetical protein